MRPASATEKHPALDLLTEGRWDDAFGTLLAASVPVIGQSRAQAMLDALHDRKDSQDRIRETVDHLYQLGRPSTGALALAWSMLTCDPARPETFWSVLPQLHHILDSTEISVEQEAALRRRLRVWWKAAGGEFNTAKYSIFRLADPEAECWPDLPAPVEGECGAEPPRAPAGPTLVVMPKSKASKLNSYNMSYKDLVDAALPLIVVHDVQAIRAALHAEFPHAISAVDALLRGLRDHRPFGLKPACLVGSAGAGKSRLVRRLAALAGGLYVHRFDGAVADGQFAGTAKGWSNSEASVPVRAVRHSMTANPIVMIDEIDKCKESQNGYLAHALLSFTDVETASRYRDQSLDAELDLSRLTFLATANDAKLLPGMLCDRFRLIRMPTPTLAHLPQLARNVMDDLAHDEERAGEPPLAADELDVIGRAWAAAGFSMRKLKAIVEASLDARDACAVRH